MNMEEKNNGLTELMHIVMNMVENKNYDYLGEYLREYPDEIDKQDCDGCTALMFCVGKYRGQSTLETTRILIGAGCNLDTKNKDNKTALILACSHNNYEAIKLLVRGGCNLDIQDADGNTALAFVCANNDHKSASLLINAGCNLNTKNKQHYTPLILSCFLSDSEIVRLLIDAGCDLGIDFSNDATTLSGLCGSSNPHKAMNIKLLIDACYILYSNTFKKNDMIMTKNQYMLKLLLDRRHILNGDRLYCWDAWGSIFMTAEEGLNE